MFFYPCFIFDLPHICHVCILGHSKAIVHGVAKSWTGLSDFTCTFHFHALEKDMARDLAAAAETSAEQIGSVTPVTPSVRVL